MKTTEKILSEIKTQLGSTYKVITAYDETEKINLNGVLAVSISDLENLHHEPENDFRIGVTVAGMVLT